MLIRDVVRIEQPFESVAPQFLRDPAWLEALLSSAAGEGTARCQRGTARRRADSLVVPVRLALESTTLSWSVSGDLAIAPIDVSCSAVTFEATFTAGDPRQVQDLEQAVAVCVHAFLASLSGALHTDEGT